MTKPKADPWLRDKLDEILINTSDIKASINNTNIRLSNHIKSDEKFQENIELKSNKHGKLMRWTTGIIIMLGSLILGFLIYIKK